MLTKSTHQRIYAWAYQQWFGDSVTEYSFTDLKDEDLIKKIIFKFSDILKSPSWNEEFKALDFTPASTEIIWQGTILCLQLIHT